MLSYEVYRGSSQVAVAAMIFFRSVLILVIGALSRAMLAKGRKAAGRGEDMGAHYAFGPMEDDPIITHRLLTRSTTTRGEPPLKKLQKKFMSFTTDIEKDADNVSKCEWLYKAFLQEMNTFELPLLKSKVVVNANLREKESFNELQVEIPRQILQAQADIEDLKKQLEESKIERQHKEECETIRSLCSLHSQKLRNSFQIFKRKSLIWRQRMQHVKGLWSLGRSSFPFSTCCQRSSGGIASFG